MTFEEFAQSRDLDYKPTEYEIGLAFAAWNAAVLVEREACAKVCDEGAAALNVMGERDGAKGAMSCAAAIRMRSNAIELTGSPIAASPATGGSDVE